MDWKRSYGTLSVCCPFKKDFFRYCKNDFWEKSLEKNFSPFVFRAWRKNLFTQVVFLRNFIFWNQKKNFLTQVYPLFSGRFFIKKDIFRKQSSLEKTLSNTEFSKEIKFLKTISSRFHWEVISKKFFNFIIFKEEKHFAKDFSHLH